MSKKTASNHLRLLLALALAAACAACAAIAATAAPSCSAPSFTLPPIYAVGTDPRSIATADFDGDGRADIVSANTGSDSVTVLTKMGRGVPATANSYAVGRAPLAVAAADFNGDGHPDIVTADNSAGTVTVLTNDGAGGFGGPPATFAVGASPRSIAVGDFNGDGRADLAVACQTSFLPVVVLLGNRQGGFGAANAFQAGQQAAVYIAAADLNGDGRADLAVATSGAAQILLGDGNGSFARVTTAQCVPQPAHDGIAIGDLNGDGKPDMVAADLLGTQLHVMKGDGTGCFTASTNINVSDFHNNERPRYVTLADLNGDGHADIVAESTVALGDGAGGFGPPTSFANASAQYLTVADFNGDGRADLALVNISVNSVSVVLGDGAGGFGAAASFNLAAKGPQAITAADFNGDGRADIAVANIGPPSPSVSVLFGDGAGGFGPAAHFAAPQNPSGITAADFNGDGLTDLVTSNNIANNVSVMLDTCGAATGDSPAVQFSAPNYNVGEGAGSVTVTVTRTGSLAGAASVRYATSDGAASERSDYIAAYGTLSFAPGEGAKSFKVLVIDDARALEGNESFNLTLSDAAGATLGSTSSATVTIQDNDLTLTTANPIDTPSFFVRQHYYDFLNREPDDAGLQFWTQGITSCGSDANCIEVKRINTSAAFFLSIEFQETGYLVYRFYKVAYGDATSPNVAGTVPIVRLREFLGDTQEIGQGVEVGIGDWQQRLEANKGAFAQEFIKRQRFLDAYPLTMTDDAFVDKLNRNSGGVLTQAERDQLVTRLAQSDTLATRGDVLRQVAENSALKAKESNRAFVLMQYFGYLRRNPDDAPDADFRGWKFWLDKLDQFGGDFVRAEMVKAFLVSAEYRQRFNGPDGL